MPNHSISPRYQLNFRDTIRVLWPYVKRNFLNQIEGIWFIVTYLVIFQLLVLQLPISAFPPAWSWSRRAPCRAHRARRSASSTGAERPG